MKQTITRIAIGGALLASLSLGAACSSGDDADPTTAAPTTSAAASAAPSAAASTSAEATEPSEIGPISGKPQPTLKPEDIPPTPTPAELNEKLAKAFDPAVSKDEKVNWIQYGDRDPELVDKLTAAASAASVVVNITQVNEPIDGKLTAQADVTVGGVPNPTTIEFVAERGEWKVSNVFTCSIVRAAGVDTAACSPDA